MNKKGFSLTEVVIGMFILSVAIVSSVTLLSDLRRSNKNNVMTIQANYLAMEGIEAVRNMRDSNWLHNFEWIGDGGEVDVWGVRFEFGEKYGVSMTQVAPAAGRDINRQQLLTVRPWNFVASDEGGEEVVNLKGEETEFRRYVEVMEVPESLDVEDSVMVKSTVMFDLGARERDVTIYTILTDWQNGS